MKISLIELIANLKVQVQVTCTEGLGARFWRIIRPVRQFIILTFYLLLRISARNSKEKSTMFNSEPITLLDTFVLNGEPGDGGTIYKKHYIDRYYPGIFDYLSKNEKKTTIYYPTIVGFHNPRKPFKLIRECREAFVIPDDFLMLRDYFLFRV